MGNLFTIPLNVRLFISPPGDDKTDRILSAAREDAAEIAICDGHNVLNPDRWPWLLETRRVFSGCAPAILRTLAVVMNDGDTLVLIGFDSTCKALCQDPVAELVKVNDLFEERGVEIYATWSDFPDAVPARTIDLTSRTEVEANNMVWDLLTGEADIDSFAEEHARILDALTERCPGRFWLSPDCGMLTVAVLPGGEDLLAEVMPSARPSVIERAAFESEWEIAPETLTS